uniref:Uncharacterized protein n=1 Tax=viral metagenome TaxID=1070528 RepID=A0A6C0LKV5_9ZZZZ
MDKNASEKFMKCKKEFLYNAIEDGWTVKKMSNYYIFRKKHEGKKEVFQESYLSHFIEKHLHIK